MTSQLQRPLSNNITVLCRDLIMDIVFAMLLQHLDMVEERRNLKTTALQHRHDVVCLLGFNKLRNWKGRGWLRSVFQAHQYSSTDEQLIKPADIYIWNCSRKCSNSITCSNDCLKQNIFNFYSEHAYLIKVKWLKIH